MKPGPEENHKLVDFEFLGVKPLCIFPKKRERSYTPSLGNVFFWDMDLPKKDIDFMTHRKGGCSIADMSSSTSRNMDLTIHPNLRRRERQVYLEYSDESTETFESPAHSDEPSETADSPAPPP